MTCAGKGKEFPPNKLPSPSGAAFPFGEDLQYTTELSKVCFTFAGTFLNRNMSRSNKFWTSLVFLLLLGNGLSCFFVYNKYALRLSLSSLTLSSLTLKNTKGRKLFLKNNPTLTEKNLNAAVIILGKLPRPVVDSVLTGNEQDLFILVKMGRLHKNKKLVKWAFHWEKIMNSQSFKRTHWFKSQDVKETVVLNFLSDMLNFARLLRM